jgi:hypothetical protein
VFYLFSQVIIQDVYKYAVIGALFELLALPMVLLLGIIPIVCIVQLVKFKGGTKRNTIFSLVVIGATVLLLFLTS